MNILNLITEIKSIPSEFISFLFKLHLLEMESFASVGICGEITLTISQYNIHICIPFYFYALL